MNLLASPVTLAECVALLEARRRAVCDELAHDGAAAVPACDAHFNTLLAERAELVAAIARLAPIARAESEIPHPRED